MTNGFFFIVHGNGKYLIERQTKQGLNTVYIESAAGITIISSLPAANLLEDDYYIRHERELAGWGLIFIFRNSK